MLAVAGGGIALSSVLNIINNLFNKRFDFERTEDRQTFIQLNCAFYDIRKDIQQSGFLDVKTKMHEEDKDRVQSLVKVIEKEVELLNKSLKKIEKVLSEDRSKYFIKNQGQIFKLSSELKKVKKDFETTIMTSADKLFVIQSLATAAPLIAKELDEYTYQGGSKIFVLDELFKQQINLLDYVKNPEGIRTLVKMGPEEFAGVFLEDLKFHFNRIIAETDKDADKLEKQWKDSTYVEGEKLVEYYKKLQKNFLKKINKRPVFI